MYLQRPVAPQYTPETIAAIKQAIAGKEQILWDTEQAIIAAINIDTSLTLLQKASEVSRSMNRFISSAQGMSTATNPFPVFGDMAYAHSFTTPVTETEPGKEYSLIFPGDVFNKYKGIDVFSGGEHLFEFKLVIVADSHAELDGVGIAIISTGNNWTGEFKDELFNAVMGALDQTGETDKYSYTVRKTPMPGMDPDTTSDVLYIDLANNDDPLEVESFSDLLKGNIAEAVPYELLFREVN